MPCMVWVHALLDNGTATACIHHSLNCVHVRHGGSWRCQGQRGLCQQRLDSLAILCGPQQLAHGTNHLLDRGTCDHSHVCGSQDTKVSRGRRVAIGVDMVDILNVGDVNRVHPVGRGRAVVHRHPTTITTFNSRRHHGLNVRHTVRVMVCVPQHDVPRQLRMPGFVGRNLVQHAGDQRIGGELSGCASFQRRHCFAHTPFHHRHVQHRVHERALTRVVRIRVGRILVVLVVVVVGGGGGGVHGPRNVQPCRPHGRPAVVRCERVGQPGMPHFVHRRGVRGLHQPARCRQGQEMHAVPRKRRHRRVFRRCHAMPVRGEQVPRGRVVGHGNVFHGLGMQV
eukprot:m.115479 g.115479  ORF g.115479 m.115479 type:complete len:338 (+) comp10880_c0_seq1:678-1691(+)